MGIIAFGRRVGEVGRVTEIEIEIEIGGVVLVGWGF